MSERRHITVSGIVQGVGFRPFVHGLALKNGLAGFVLNHPAGVTIELEGEQPALNNFLTVLTEAPPPLARIESIDCSIVPPTGESEFKIIRSHGDEQRKVLISPDTPTCEGCLEELFDASDRRYRYPFINCTHCGPRFTIIKDVPYDRERTTMGRFTMCADCAREYHDPAHRRFHAQANACPRCGPRLRLLDSQGRESAEPDAVFGAARLLRQGAILAVKGLGGYHLACNALDHDAVRRLRARKHREDKPFALMARDLRAVRELCVVAPEDEMLLSSLARPIVLLRKHENISIGAAVAPGQRRLGVMLPYTPLHHLLLADADMPLVMTSGNLSEEPIAYRDDDALRRLGQIADYFLVHDREIHTRCDDSVARTIDRRALIIRRARGYAPQPISLRVPFVQPVLACGGHLKNTFCLAKDRHAFLSHHIGDLENYETLDSFTQGIEHFKNLFAIEPAGGRARSSPRLSLQQIRYGGCGRAEDRRPAPPRAHRQLHGRARPCRPGNRRCLRRIGLWGRWHDLGWRISDRGFIAIRAPRPFAQRAHGGRQPGHSRALAHGAKLPAGQFREGSSVAGIARLAEHRRQEDRPRYSDDRARLEYRANFFMRAIVRRGRRYFGFAP